MSVQRVLTIHFIRTPDFWSRLIALVTGEKYTHAFTEIPYKTYIESALWRGTTRFYSVREDVSAAGTIDLLCTQEQRTRYVEYLISQLGNKYNFSGAVCAGLRLPFRRNVRGAHYCSSLIADALAYAGIITIQGNITPDALFRKLQG